MCSSGERVYASCLITEASRPYRLVALRIVRVSPPGQSGSSDHKTGIGPGGCKIEASRNFWDSSGLKMESTNTDVAWAYGCMQSPILGRPEAHPLHSLQQQDLDQCSERRAHNVGSKQVWGQVRCVHTSSMPSLSHFPQRERAKTTYVQLTSYPSPRSFPTTASPAPQTGTCVSGTYATSPNP